MEVPNIQFKANKKVELNAKRRKRLKLSPHNAEDLEK